MSDIWTPPPTPSAPREPVARALLAPRFRRLVAYLIDVIPITLVLHFVVAGLTDYDLARDAFERNRRDWDTALEFYGYRNFVRDVSFLLYIAYSGVMDASPLQGTLGKYLLGIQVVGSNGERLTASRAVTRNLAKIASYGICMLGFIWILFTKDRQGWHDIIARAYVTRR